MVKKILAFFSGLLLLLAFSTPSLAQQEAEVVDSEEGISSPDYFPPNPEPGFLGQDHAYTVVFRGNGEAVVSSRVAFTNKTDSELSEITLRIPRVKPDNISVYQVLLEPPCIRYSQSSPRVCLEYGTPDYYQGNYYNAKYQRAGSEFSADTLKIELPSSVSPEASGAFFVYFRTAGYAEKDVFGAYNYTFETFKAEDDIRNLRVGVSTDSDLFLKNSEGEVQYRFEDAAVSQIGAVGSAEPVESRAIDSFVSQIGRGRVTEMASNLAALESFTVEGAYADTRAKLYGKEIAIGLAVILVLIGIAILAVKFGLKKFNPVKGDGVAEEVGRKMTDTTRQMFISTGASFAGSLLILGYTIAVFVLGNILTGLVGYQYRVIITMLLVVISFVIYALLLFAPGVYIGAKKGVGWGIGTIVATVIWLILYMLLAVFVIFILGGGGNNYPGPIPLLEGTFR